MGIVRKAESGYLDMNTPWRINFHLFPSRTLSKWRRIEKIPVRKIYLDVKAWRALRH